MTPSLNFKFQQERPSLFVVVNISSAGTLDPERMLSSH